MERSQWSSLSTLNNDSWSRRLNTATLDLHGSASSSHKTMGGLHGLAERSTAQD